MRATRGETQAPNGAKVEVDIVNVFVVNLGQKSAILSMEGELLRTREIRSTRSAAVSSPYSAIACGELRPRKWTTA